MLGVVDVRQRHPLHPAVQHLVHDHDPPGARSASGHVDGLRGRSPVRHPHGAGGLRQPRSRHPAGGAHPATRRRSRAADRHARDEPRRPGRLGLAPGPSGVPGVPRGVRALRPRELRSAGVGESSPITCGSSAPTFRRFDLAPDSPVEQVALETGAMALAAQCERDAGGRLAHFGTLDVARDVESLRLAVGEERLSFVGLSRTAPTSGSSGRSSTPRRCARSCSTVSWIRQETGSGTSVDQLDGDRRIVRRDRRSMRRHPGCPVTPDGGVIAAYDRLAERVEAGAGAAAGVGPTQLTYAAFLYATYGSEHWPDPGTRAHTAASAGDLTGVASTSRRRSPTWWPTWSSCGDVPRLTPSQRSAALAGRTPGIGRGLPPVRSGAGQRAAAVRVPPVDRLLPHRSTCRAPRRSSWSAAPGDVATPYEQAQRVARGNLDAGGCSRSTSRGHVAHRRLRLRHRGEPPATWSTGRHPCPDRC